MAQAHVGQHLGLRIQINDEAVAYEVLLSADFLNALLEGQLDPPDLRFEDGRFHFNNPEQARRHRQVIEDFFAYQNPVTVDGILVQPILTDLQYLPAVAATATAPATTAPSDTQAAGYTGFATGDALDSLPIDPALPPDIRIELTYPVKGRAKQVSMVWDLYPQDATRIAQGLAPALDVLAELDAYDQNKIIRFTEEEPEIIWHAPSTTVRERIQPVIAKLEPRAVRVPLVSILLVVAGGTAILFTRRLEARRPGFRLGAALGILIVVILTWPVGVIPISLPGTQRVTLPEPQRALEVFESLHRNVYRAFDYKSESDIYDALAQSVGGTLLDRIYNEIYQSLILRDQGGAVARVQSVDVLDRELLSTGTIEDTAQPAFRVHCRWQVHGAVYHWGHVHARTNEYQANYTVAQVDENWKILAAEVLAQQRIPMPGDDPAFEDPGTTP